MKDMCELCYWFMIFCGPGLLISLFALYRNQKVYEFRVKMIGTPMYEELPEYDTMFLKFWVWPMERFLLQKHRRKRENA